MGVRLLIFFLCWIAWCAFSMFWLGPKIAAHHLNDHRALIVWILCVIPLVLYAIAAVRFVRTRGKF